MKTIDRLLARFGLWLALRTNTVSATAMMMDREVKNRKCEHCGLSPIHYLDDCECKK